MGETRKLAAILVADVVGYSRLAGADEERILAQLRTLRADLIDPTIARHHGRVVKRTGDGSIVELRSVVDAVRCAVELQNAMAEHNAGVPEDEKIQFRVGVHLGDVVEEEDGDLMGDGVNIAARLEGIAERGGICISEDAYRQVRDKIKGEFIDLGEKELKNIARPVRVFAVRVGSAPAANEALAEARQQIRFCRAPDGVQLAHARMGQGPPLVRAGAFLTHLEKELESPIWRHMWSDLGREHTIVRYDARGNGLSDWDVDELSFDAFVRDLETVVDAEGLDRFALFGVSQGCAISIAYAVRHPERVAKLVLYGGYAQGGARRARTAAEREQFAAVLTLVRLGWGQENPAFRQIFTSQFVPGGTKQQIDWWNEMQRVSASPENAARYIAVVGDIDVTELLPKVSVPTLVLHGRDDARVPFDVGRRMAAGIPGARFVPLQSRNHLILESEPAYPQFLAEIRSFLGA